MKKEAEIKILASIQVGLRKLINGDTYFNDEMKHRNIDPEDINKMIINIKNDFPLFMGTGLEKSLIRGVELYRKRCGILSSNIFHKQIRINGLKTLVKDHETELGGYKKARQAALDSIIDEEMAQSPEEVAHLRTELYKTFPDAQVIVSKLRKGFPLSKDELDKVSTSLFFTPF